jgi:hypothetical protein
MLKTNAKAAGVFSPYITQKKGNTDTRDDLSPDVFVQNVLRDRNVAKISKSLNGEDAS